jgi:hypothetical protein
MAESNLHALNINFLAIFNELDELATPQVAEAFATSPWYADIIYVYIIYKLLLV